MFERIVPNPAILAGKPCIKSTRISGEFLLELAASGASRDEIVQAYPYLTRDDVEATFQYTTSALREGKVKWH